VSALTRFLYPVPAPRSIGSIIGWWERRRLSYNLVVGAAGLIMLLVVRMLGRLPPGSHDALPSGSIMGAYALFANLCYTSGWALEGMANAMFGDELLPFGPSLFRQGLLFSVELTVFPIVIAVIQWAMRLVA
jgi:hypothetical protein